MKFVVKPASKSCYFCNINLLHNKYHYHKVFCCGITTYFSKEYSRLSGGHFLFLCTECSCKFNDYIRYIQLKIAKKYNVDIDYWANYNMCILSAQKLCKSRDCIKLEHQKMQIKKICKIFNIDEDKITDDMITNISNLEHVNPFKTIANIISESKKEMEFIMYINKLIISIKTKNKLNSAKIMTKKEKMIHYDNLHITEKKDNELFFIDKSGCEFY